MAKVQCPVCSSWRTVENVVSEDGFHNPPCWKCGDPGWTNPLNAEDPFEGRPA